MKLRVRGDSIRLRVTRGELDRLGGGGTCVERLQVAPGAAFEYRLRVRGDAGPTAASYADGVLEVGLGRAAFAAWAGSDREVGIRASQDNGSDGLSLLVEKDFPCLTDREGEDDSDAFAKPAGADAAARC